MLGVLTRNLIRWKLGYWLIAMVCLTIGNLTAQTSPGWKKPMQKADSLYHEADYEEAWKLYDSLAGLQLKDEAKARALIGKSKASIWLNKYERARKTLSAGLDWSALKPLRRDSFTAIFLYHLGNVYQDRSQYDSAFFFHRKAHQIQEKVLPAKHPDHGNTLEALGMDHLYVGQYDSVTYYLSRARDKKKAAFGPQSVEMAYAENALALFHLQTGDYPKAIDHLHVAQGILEAELGPGHLHTGILYNNLANSYNKIGQPARALSYYEKVERVFADKAPPEQRAMLLYNQALMHIERGDTERAMPDLFEALELFESNLGSDHERLISIYNGIGAAFLDQGRWVQAVSYFNKAGQIQSESPRLKAQVAYNLGICLQRMDSLSKAIASFQTSMQYARQAHNQPHQSVANTLCNLGECYTLREDYAKAKSAYEEALALYRQVFPNGHAYIAYTQMRMAQVFNRQGNRRKARALISLALQHMFIREVQGDEIHSLQLRDLRFNQYLLIILEVYGDIYLSSYQQEHKIEWLEKSLAAFRLARDYFIQKRNLIQGEKSRQDWSGYTVTLFQKAVEAAHIFIQQGHLKMGIRDAWNFLCLNQSLTLQEAIHKQEIARFSRVPDDVLRKERMLKSRMQYYRSQAHSIIDADARQVFREAEKKYFDFLDSLENTYPAYFRLKFHTPLIGIEQVQTYLDSLSATFVQYFFTGESVFGLLIKRDTAILLELAEKNTIDSLAKIWQASVFQQNPVAFSKAAYMLYEKLWSPFEAYDIESHCLVIPDGLLWNLSFEAFIDEKSVDEVPRFADMSYLIYRYGIHYIYSAPENPGNYYPDNSSRLLAIAPGFDENIRREITSLDSVQRTKLHPGYPKLIRQPWTVQMTENLSKKYGGTYLIGLDATERAFRSHIQDAQILHMGTHARIDFHEPDRSGIAFAIRKKEFTSPDNDGFLLLSEIYGLYSQATCAVLTACETGLGKTIPGDGVISLARAFRYVGVENIVMSLWALDAKITSMLTEAVYAGLSEKKQIHQAVRDAKLYYLQNCDKELCSPYYWAGLVLIGQDGVVYLTEKTNHNYWLIAIVLLIGVGLWLLSKKLEIL